MAFFAICRAKSPHAVKDRDWRRIDGVRCPHCDDDRSTFQVIRFVATNAPRDYAGKTATIKVRGKRFTIEPVDFTERETRKRSRSEAAGADGPEKKKVRVQIDDSDESDDEAPSDVEDSAWVGTTEPFKGVHSRLSVNGHYAERPNLANVIAARGSRPKMKLKDIGGAVPRGGGQSIHKGYASAVQATSRNLPTTQILHRGAPVAATGEEWCHLWASCLGGSTNAGNLVAASYACNTYMMAIETTIKSRTDLSISVSAYCSDAQSNCAEAIRYRIYKRSSSALLFDQLIDATAQHFSRTDLDALQTRLAPVRNSKT